MKLRLYGLPGSHPTMAVQAMLERKGLAHTRIDPVPFLARTIVRRRMRMPANTVPVLSLDRRPVGAQNDWPTSIRWPSGSRM